MTRQTAFSHSIITAVTAAMLVLSPIARAELVETQELATQNQTEQDRAKVQSFVERASVKEKLETMGVAGAAGQRPRGGFERARSSRLGTTH